MQESVGICYKKREILYCESAVVVPAHLRQQVVDENHDPVFAGYFSEKKLMEKLSRSYFWPGMRRAIIKKCTSCVTCALVQGQINPLKSIPV